MTSRARPAVLDGHSIEASTMQTEPRLREVQVVVLDVLRVAGPLTDDQLISLYEQRAENYPGVPRATPQSIRSRRSELRNMGLVVASDKKGTSKYGNPSTVWMLAKKEAA